MSTPRVSRRTGQAALVLGAALVVATPSLAVAAPASAAPAPGAVQPAPVLPRDSVAAGAVADATPMALTVLLRPRDPAGLAAAAAAVTDPSSPGYRHFLTPAQIADRFGPTPAQLAAVSSQLRAAGLSVGRLAPSHLSLSVTGQASTAANAFHTHLARRQVNGQAFYANTTAAMLPAGASGVLGLDNLARRFTPAATAPVSSVSVNGSAQPATAHPAVASCSGPSGHGWSPSDLATAYDANPLYQAGNDGAGQTIALFELAGFAASDIAAYDACYGIHTNVSTVPVDGGAAVGSGTSEATWDIEDAAGIAPGASIAVYEAPNTDQGTYDEFSAMVNADTASVISISWGQCEQLSSPNLLDQENALFEQAAAQGQSVIAVSGDSGSEDCYDGTAASPTNLAVDDPASQPWVTSVGGTTLSSVSPRTETVWNSAYGAGGGGKSTVWPQPPWQTAVAPGATTREVPDISASSDPRYGYPLYCTAGDCSSYATQTGTGWAEGGGTSLAAPMVGAFVAASNQACGAPAGFLNPAIYANPSAFHDITTGNNDLGFNPGFYSATTGYDMATGLGSPDVAALSSALCSRTWAVTGSGQLSPASVAFGGRALGTPATLNVVLRNTSPAPLIVRSATVSGAAASDFTLATDGCSGTTVPGGGSCTMTVRFDPTADGNRAASLAVADSAPDGSQAVPLSGVGGTATGYRLVAGDGGIFSYGGAPFYGSIGGHPLNQPVVGMANDPAGGGYWMVARDGGVFSFGQAKFFGSAAGKTTSPVVGMASTPDGGGYWVADAQGDVFGFGDATVSGSASGLNLVSPIVGIAMAPAGGYWLVSADGGIFSYGGAPFYGSIGGHPLNQPIVGMSVMPGGGGYRFVAADGGVFDFGAAAFYGSEGGQRLNRPIVGMATSADGAGYWLVAADGGIFTFGDAVFNGSAGALNLVEPISGMSAG